MPKMAEYGWPMPVTEEDLLSIESLDDPRLKRAIEKNLEGANQ